MKLVLDIDQTLVWSQPFSGYEKHVLHHVYLLHDGLYATVERPGVDIFLKYCIKWFDVIIWTAGLKEYADTVVPLLLRGTPSPPILSQEDCTKFTRSDGQYFLVKDLSKIPGSDEIIMVDDNPASSHFQPEKSLLMFPFVGDNNDFYLFFMLVYLWGIKNAKTDQTLKTREWMTEARLLYFEWKDSFIQDSGEDVEEWSRCLKKPPSNTTIQF